MRAGRVLLANCVERHRDDVDAYYECLRLAGGERGLAWDPSLEAWCVVSYDLCSWLLRSGGLTRRPISLLRSGDPDAVDEAEKILNSQFLFAEKKTAAVRRRYWTSVLLAGMKDEGYARLDHLADEALEAVPRGRRFDVYQELLQPFASRVAASCLGVPEEAREDLYPSICAYVRFFDGKLTSVSDYHAAIRGIVCLFERLGSAHHPYGPPPGYPETQWVADLVLTLVAGHESTAYLLATIFRQLARPPGANAVDGEVLRRLLAEALRFDSPIQLLSRRLNDDQTELLPSGCRGSDVYLHIGAANRDPAAFPDPASFSPTRAGPTPLSFGLGESRCPGRSVATQAAFAFLRTLGRRREWLLVESAEVDHGVAARGLRALPGVRTAL